MGCPRGKEHSNKYDKLYDGRNVTVSQELEGLEKIDNGNESG